MSEDPRLPSGLGPAPYPAAPRGPEGPQPSPEVAAGFTRRGRRAMWLGGLSLLLALFFYPLGIVTGVAALVIGVLALRAARPYRARVPGAAAGVVMGAIGLVFSLLVTAFAAFLYNEISTYTRCRDAANTITDENQCKDAFARALEKKLHLKPGSVDGRKMPF